ncbi:hypothetical protein EDB83DRAFT_2358793, partial [Lactarius deliciosus]
DGRCVDEKASWTERMRAVAQSSIVLSIFRDLVANAVFMKRGPQSALMEFFPIQFYILITILSLTRVRSSCGKVAIVHLVFCVD